MLKDFREFLLKQNVVALAIAVVVGTALNALVKAVVDDFIMPVIAYMQPGGNWRTVTWDLGPVKFGVGDFAAAVLNFLIVGLVAWRISKIFIRDTPKKNCPFCKESIDASATRCSHCTSQFAAA
ncbi:MAG TPA: MscL family protein [Gemmatimonadaceae bacterium]|nr:MscL family protein [Gemmatimonadaceae bacterium]